MKLPRIPRPLRLRSAAILAGLAVLAGVASAQSLLAPPKAPGGVPDLAFTDGEGNKLKLSDFRGKVVLLNLWATWCSPCREELPALDRLQAELGGPGFEVVALSIDRGGASQVREFFAEHGITRLRPYNDPRSRALRELQATGIPVTLLIDRAGREIGRVIGPAEWDSPDVVDLIRQHLAEPRPPEEAEAPAGRPAG